MDNGEDYILPDEELPLELPVLDDYQGHNGKAPLENAEEWKNYDKNGIKGIRETSTMPGSAGSSWYFLRYIDPHNDDVFADYELLKHWMPVDLYLGGPEHAVGHLIYSRIWNNFLYDKGLVPVKEPFKKLVHQGMILGSNGIKMGKRFPEYCVNPSDVVREYGADTIRLYEMFMGPLEASKPWSDQGAEGARKFLDRVYRAIVELGYVTDEEVSNLDTPYNKMVKNITEDYDNLSFNTAISEMMIFMNAVYKEEKLPKKYAEGFVKVLNPVAPHITEEMWEKLGHDNTIAYEKWPTYDESKLVEDTFEMVVQVNGKVRGKLEVTEEMSEEEIKSKAKEIENVKRFIEGQTIVKEIVIPKKLVSIVVK